MNIYSITIDFWDEAGCSGEARFSTYLTKESDKKLHSVTSRVSFDYSSIQHTRGERPRVGTRDHVQQTASVSCSMSRVILKPGTMCCRLLLYYVI